VASDFSVLKNEPRRLSDFPGHFSGSGRVVRLVFAWFWGPGSSGRVVWGDKTKTRHFSGSLGCVATYRLVLQKMSLFVLHTKNYIADRAFFDLIFSFWHKPFQVKNRKNHFCEKTRFLKKVKFAFFCPSRCFVKKSQIENFRVFFKIVQ
jgi:hypothetical protein